VLVCLLTKGGTEEGKEGRFVWGGEEHSHPNTALLSPVCVVLLLP
jgi:hypothetical protein